LLGYFAAVTGPLSIDPRFMIVAVPFIALLAGYGMATRL